MEQEIHTDAGTRGGITPNANVQAAVAQMWEVIRRAGEILISVREDNQALTARVATLEQRVGGQEDYVSGMQSEAEALRAELAGRDEDIAVLRMAVEQSERDRVAGETAVGELRDRVDRYEETIRRLTLRIAEQEEHIGVISRTAEQYAQAQEALAGASQQEAALSATIAELRDKLAAALTASKDADFLRAELVRRNTELNSRINEALHHKERAAEFENKLYELQQVQTSLREARAALHALGEELDAAKLIAQQSARAAEHYEELQQRLEELQQQLEESQSMEQELLVRIQQLHDDNDVVRRRAEEQQTHIVELSGQLIQLRAHIHESEKSTIGSSATMELLAGELEVLRSQAEREAVELRLLQAERDTTELARLVAEEECAVLRQKCAELAEELQHTARMSVSRDVIEEKEAQIVELLLRVEEKERDTEQLRRRLDDVQTVGSLFSIARQDTAGAGVVPEERSAVIASVQALLQRVEHVLRAEPESGH